MRSRSALRTLALATAFAAGCAGSSSVRTPALPPGAISADAVRAHVAALTAPEMDGRLTGTEGERRATDYVARQFIEAGLVPAGVNETWFQPFEFTAGVSLGPANSLRWSDESAPSHKPVSLVVDRDWRPLSFSRTGAESDVPVVFAGYGIVAPAEDGGAAYDSYADADVKDKLVLVLRYAPQGGTPEQRQHLARYASLRHKAMLARDHGARGLLVVSGPRSKVREQLVALQNDAAVGATSVYVASLTDEVASGWLAGAGQELGALQDALDTGAVRSVLPLRARVSLRIDLVQERRSGRNVLGRLRTHRGGDVAPVLIGAHVDHLGHGDDASSLAREGERGRVHPGADDNASGVAAVIEIARRLSAEARVHPGAFARDVIFAAWSGEEVGIIGSTAYARDLPDPVALAHGAPRTLDAVLNLDMVGRLRGTLILQGTGSSPAWPDLIARANAPLGLTLVLQPEAYLPTDSTAFHLKGIPVLSAFTGSHAEYHTPRDTPDLLNYPGLASVAELVAGVGAGLAKLDGMIGRAEPPPSQAMTERAGLRVYLGTVPSYAGETDPGVTLSGVAAGGPAERAGLRAGDRIVELAGHGVENIYDYTYALDALAVGEAVPIVVVRDGARVTLSITPASRD